MPKLKCIGGELDGQWHYVPDNLRYGDIIRLQKPQQPVAVMVNYQTDGPLDITFEYMEYRFSEITGHDRRLQFLVPKEMTDYDAIKFQFEK